MSSLPPDEGASRSEAIAERLRDQILDGKYEAGERLPSERDLASRIGANRSSVREALKKLEQLGMIQIRRGGGARVLPLEEAGLGVVPHLLASRRPDRDLVAQWLDVWELVLAGSTRLAVERGSDEEFAEADVLLKRLVSKSISPEDFVATADALTELIAVASRNVVLRMVRNGLTAQLENRKGLRAELRPPRNVVLPMIKAIQTALADRDAVAAAEGVRRLIRLGRRHVIDAVAGPSGAS